MPQPYSTERQGNVYKTGTGTVAARPECALGIARVADTWSGLEDDLRGLFAIIVSPEWTTIDDVTLNGSPNLAAMAIFDAITNTTTRMSVTRPAFEQRLSKELMVRLDDLFRRIRRKAGERNDVVHGNWGLSDAKPKALILLQPFPQKGEMAYEPRDFEAIVRDTEALAKELRGFGRECATYLYEVRPLTRPWTTGVTRLPESPSDQTPKVPDKTPE